VSETISDFVEVEELSKPMSEGEYNAFLARMNAKGYFNHAITEGGVVISANDQILAGANILVSAGTNIHVLAEDSIPEENKAGVLL
jgi:hypothetical protein